jgi:hypothetical protein
MTTDLVSRAERVRDLARQLHDTGALRQELSRLQDRHQRLSELRRGLSAQFPWFVLAAKHGLETDATEYQDLVSRREDAAVRVQELALAFEADSTILEHRSYTRLESDLATLTNEARRLADATWSSHVSALTPLVDPELLRALRTIPSFARSLGTIESLLSRIDRLGAVRPTSDRGFEDFRDAAEQLRTSWEEVGKDAGDGHVTDFLRLAISQSGAPLSAVTDATVAWLRSHGIEEGFRVVFVTARSGHA